MKKSLFIGLTIFMFFFKNTALANYDKVFFDFKIEDIFKAWSAGCILQGRYLDLISKEFIIRKKIDPQYLYCLLYTSPSPRDRG